MGGSCVSAAVPGFTVPCRFAYLCGDISHRPELLSVQLFTALVAFA